jgi:hypothetical protein
MTRLLAALVLILFIATIALGLLLALYQKVAADCPIGYPACGPDTFSPAAVWLPVVAR